MEFRILGPLEVHDDAGPVRVPGAKERALLADLLVHAGTTVTADRLVADLWGDEPPGRPANTLQGRVSALRRALGPDGTALLVTSPPGYRMVIAPAALDAACFQGLVAEAARRATDPPQAARLLEDALALWRGPALAEFADRPWAQAEAARLEELRLHAHEQLADLRLAEGRHAELVPQLEAFVSAQPLRERPRGQLMLALYRCGRQADALRVYDETRAVLAEELGIDPSPDLQRLHRDVLAQDPAIQAPGRTPASAAPPHRLPERLTALIGRDGDLDDVTALLRRHRLVTLTGPGGVGKTSLAVEAARRLVPDVPDGVWLLELAPLRDPARLAELVASSLGLREEPGPNGTASPAPADRLADHLRDKTLLLVLDNCEHLVEACAELAERLVRAARGVRILATGRELLGVTGEQVRPVAPLAADDALALFVARARLADPGFVLDAGAAPAAAEICRRLDGLPLAIELAAARVHVLPPAELAARLAAGSEVPGGVSRSRDPRQQTLRATVAWSFGLLAEPERRLFRRLSVFAGGWTIAAAEAVCADTTDDTADPDVDPVDDPHVVTRLVRLVDRSLVVALGGDPARFRMLETLRGYAAERLAEAGETDALAARHTAWFLALAEDAARHRTARPGVRRLDADYDDLRAAMDRATATADHVTVLRMAAALGWYWAEHHTDEGRRRLADALAAADGQPPSGHLAKALLARSMVDIERFPTLPRIAEDASRCVELFERFEDPVGAATAKVVLAQAQQQHAGPRSDGPLLVAEAESAFAAAGDRWGEAFAALNALSVDSSRLTEPGRAEAVAQGALERFTSLDDQWGRALATYVLANLARGRGRIDVAVRHYESAIAAAVDDGPLWARCACLVELGGLVAIQGDHQRATALHAEAVAICRRTGWRRGLAYAWNGLGAIARARGDLERARALHREALDIVRDEVGWSVPHTLAQLGCAEARLGDLDAAERHLGEATDLVLEAPEPVTTAVVLVGHALVALGRGRDERAAQLLAAAGAVRDRAGVAPVGVERVELDLARQAADERLDHDALGIAEATGRELDDDAALRLARDDR